MAEAMRAERSAVRRIIAGVATLVVIASLCVPSGAAAAVIDKAWASQRGAVVELHFGLHGRGVKWELSTHGQQLWIELAHTRLELPARPVYGHETAPVELVRAVDQGGARSRLVIQVSGRTDYAVGLLHDQLLVRLAPAGQVADLAAPVLIRPGLRQPPPAAAAGRAQQAATATAAASPAAVTAARAVATGGRPTIVRPAHPMLSALHRPAPPAGRADATSADDAAVAGTTAPNRHGQFLVVIDPGHGGYDAGTEVAAPLLEKELVLQIARRLQGELQRRGVRTMLTRTGDYFVPLPERTAFANRANADLFISIHLNSSPDPATSGIETYYLNNTTDRATIRLARIENAAGADGSGAPAEADLNYILSDMRQQYKANESVALASMVEAQSAADLAAALGLRVNALGAKRGPFYVLVGARMPAVLVECGFLSNRAEAARLASAQYQQILAAAIAQAAVHYFNADAAVGNL